MAVCSSAEQYVDLILFVLLNRSSLALSMLGQRAGAPTSVLEPFHAKRTRPSWSCPVFFVVALVDPHGPTHTSRSLDPARRATFCAILEQLACTLDGIRRLATGWNIIFVLDRVMYLHPMRHHPSTHAAAVVHYRAARPGTHCMRGGAREQERRT